jgi:hypothetical protein
MAFAMLGAAVLGNPGTANADILMTITDGTGSSATTYTQDFSSNNIAYLVSESIGNYNISIETTVTNYPGVNTTGTISTTVNVNSTSGTGTLEQLTVQVQLVNPGNNNSNLLWTTPNWNTLAVYAGSSFTPSLNTSSGSVTTNTYFNSTSNANTTGLGSSTISASSNVAASSTSALNYVNTPNPAGSYTLGQTVTLSGLNAGAGGFSYGGTSSVTAPEPSSLAIAGIGGLGLIGYGLRRRKALGA